MQPQNHPCKEGTSCLQQPAPGACSTQYTFGMPLHLGHLQCGDICHLGVIQCTGGGAVAPLLKQPFSTPALPQGRVVLPAVWKEPLREAWDCLCRNPSGFCCLSTLRPCTVQVVSSGGTLASLCLVNLGHWEKCEPFLMQSLG